MVCVFVCVKVFAFSIGLGFDVMNLSHTVLGFGLVFVFANVLTLSATVFTLRILNFTEGVFTLCLFINVLFCGLGLGRGVGFGFRFRIVCVFVIVLRLFDLVLGLGWLM